MIYILQINNKILLKNRIKKQKDITKSNINSFLIHKIKEI